MPCFRQRDAAGKACFPPSAAGANRSAGRHSGNLQACTGAKGRDTRLEDCSHQINLAACLRRVLVEVKRRAGHEHRIIALKICLIGQCGTSVRRLHPMTYGPRCEKAQGVDVGFAGAAPDALTTGFTGLRRLTLSNEETQLVWQREVSERRSRSGREYETLQTFP